MPTSKITQRTELQTTDNTPNLHKIFPYYKHFQRNVLVVIL